MNHIERTQDLGTLIFRLTANVLSAPINERHRVHARCQEIAESIAQEHRFEHGTPMKLRHFAAGLRRLADAVDEQAVLMAEALAEIECAKPTPEEVLGHNRALLRSDSVDIEGL